MGFEIRSAGFSGTGEEFDTVQTAIALALAKVDAAVAARPTNSPFRAANLVSTITVAGPPLAPVVNIVWASDNVTAGHPFAYEAVAEAAIRGEVAGDSTVVLHRGKAVDYGIVSFAALAAVLGF